jgi:predicted dinucleotide-binding enzyme
MKTLIRRYGALLEDKIVVDPSNPIVVDGNGHMIRTLPDGWSAASIGATLLPAGAYYVKAFGTLGADFLASGANREPRAALFYATNESAGSTEIERLIRVAGFEPLRAGGVATAARLEGPEGDLSQSGLNGALLDIDQARAALRERVKA